MLVRSIVVLAVLALVSSTAKAGVIANGSFETGDFTSWSTLGNTSIKTASFGTPVSSGTYHALMESDFGAADTLIEDFLGLSAGRLDAMSTGNATNGSAIKQTITGSIGDVLSFDWNFLTDEFGFSTNPSVYNDFAFWSLVSQNTGSILADKFFPMFTTSSTVFRDETGYHTTSVVLTSSGTFTLGFGVMNVNDTGVNSGLLVDNVTLTGVVPEPTSLAVFGIAACVAGFGAARRRRGEKLQVATA